MQSIHDRTSGRLDREALAVTGHEDAGHGNVCYPLPMLIQPLFRGGGLHRGMIPIRRSFIAALFLALPLSGLAAPAAYAQGGCLSQRETAAAVRAGEAQPFDRAVPRDLRSPPNFIGVELCRQGGGLVYVVSNLGRNGQVTRTIIDARTGRVR